MIPPRVAIPAVFAAALGLVALTPSVGPRAEATPPDGRLLSEAMEEARAGDWTAALDRARAADPGVGADIILWTRLRDGQGDFSDYADFLSRDTDWPGLARIRAQAEAKLPPDMPPSEVVAFFGRDPALTPGGALRLANALADLGRTTAAETEILRAWTTMPMSGRQQADIYTVWKKTVAPRDADRLDMLLWEGRTDQAGNMLPLVSDDWQALARARIGVREDVDGSTALIDAVPESLRDDPGLAFERYLFRVRKGRWQEAADYMLSHSTSAATLGRPEMWMPRRANLAREALQRGDVAMAYGLAASGHGTAGTDYADAEWLAGFIALTRMEDPKAAITHFETFGSLVDTPISLGRAGYWLGRAEAAAGDAAAADKAYRAAARYQTSFYGQLAAEAAGLDFDAGIAGAAPPDWQSAPGTDRAVVRAARLFLLAGDDDGAARFFRQAAEGQPAEARAAVAQMAIDSGRPHIGLRVAKDAAAAGIVLPSQYYPLHAMAAETWPVPTEWAMAIARQESEFNAAAGSDAGAKGLMQLMPATAKAVAKREGVAFDGARLTTDAIYNARLGTGYLAEMLERYGSYVLATAAYNAGPGRVDKWVAEFGDPRDPSIDPVIWIEQIPYSETRNYVMRVLEGMQVYRVRLRGAPQPVRLAADIRGAG